MAVAVIVALVIVSGNLNPAKNNFVRTFEHQPVNSISALKIDKTIRGFSGITSQSLYLETGDPNIMFKADAALQKIKAVQFSIKESMALSSMFISNIDSPFLYIAGGNIPVLIKADLNSDAVEYKDLPTKTFSRFVAISNSSFIFRMYKNLEGKWEQIFVKCSLFTNKQIEESKALDRNGDAGFTTDGLLHYDSLLHELIYVHYYNNEIICIDTNLNVLYTMHTIDKNAVPSMTANKFKAGETLEYTNTKPVYDINMQSCVDDGLLYVNSNIKADNEDGGLFKRNAVIDVYSIANRKYKSSFYVPNLNNKRLQTFKVYKNHLYALYNNRIVLYLIHN